MEKPVEREDLRDWLRPHDNDNGEWETKYGELLAMDSCDFGYRILRSRKY